jgi:hypothetical protein
MHPLRLHGMAHTPPEASKASSAAATHGWPTKHWAAGALDSPLSEWHSLFQFFAFIVHFLSVQALTPAVSWSDPAGQGSWHISHISDCLVDAPGAGGQKARG